MKTTPTALPTIHSNGTSRQTLLDGYTEARQSVMAAIRQMEKIEFNARDYYPQGDAAWKLAREQYQARLDTLTKISNELYEIMEHVCDSGGGSVA